MATAENEECAMAKEADTLLLNANQGVDFGFYLQIMNTLRDNNQGDLDYEKLT